MPNTSDWRLRKSFNTKENVMMTNHEKWVYERNIDEIIDRLRELLVNLMLMSVKKINDDQKFLMDRMGLNQDDELKF